MIDVREMGEEEESLRRLINKYLKVHQEVSSVHKCASCEEITICITKLNSSLLYMNDEENKNEKKKKCQNKAENDRTR